MARAAFQARKGYMPKIVPNYKDPTKDLVKDTASEAASAGWNTGLNIVTGGSVNPLDFVSLGTQAGALAFKGAKHVQRKNALMKEISRCLDEYTACRYLHESYSGKGKERTYTATYEFYSAGLLFKVYKDIEQYVLEQRITNAELDSLGWQRDLTIYSSKQLPDIIQRLSQCCITSGVRDVTQTDLEQRFNAISFPHIGEIALKNACLAKEVIKTRSDTAGLANGHIPLPVFGRILSLLALCGISEIEISDITTVLGKIPMFETVARARIASLRNQHPSNVINSVLFGGSTDSVRRDYALHGSSFKGEHVMVGRIEAPGRARFDTLWENNLCEFSEMANIRHPVGTPIFLLAGWANLIAHREEFEKGHSSLKNIVRSGCYISSNVTDVHGNTYMHPGSLRSILFSIEELSDGSLMAKPKRFDNFNFLGRDEKGTGQERHFGGMVGGAAPCGCSPDSIKGRLTQDWKYGETLEIRSRDYVGNPIEHTQELSAKNITILWRPGDYALGMFLMQTLPQSSYLQGKGECLHCAVENAALAGCPEVIACGGARESEKARASRPGITKTISSPAELQISTPDATAGLARTAKATRSESVVPITNSTGVVIEPVLPWNPGANANRRATIPEEALNDDYIAPLEQVSSVRPVTRDSGMPMRQVPRSATGAQHGNVGQWLQDLDTSYKDPAQVIAEDVPIDRVHVGKSPTYNIAKGHIGNPELTTSEYGRMLDQRYVPRSEMASSNWPMRTADINSQDWPKKPRTGSMENLTPPPKPPKDQYLEIMAEDALPLRPGKGNAFETGYTEESAQDGVILTPPSRQSLSALNHDPGAANAELPVSLSLRSDRSLVSLAGSDVQYLGTARPITITRTQPLPAENSRSRGTLKTVPSPPPSKSMFPLPSSSSPRSRNNLVENTQPQQHARSFPSGQISPTRPSVITHVRPLSPEGPLDTPVAEAGSPMTPQLSLDSGRPRFPTAVSKTSASPPPGSPPPPYSNRVAKTKRRLNSFYTLAEQKGNQIIPGSPPPSATHPALRKDSLTWLSSQASATAIQIGSRVSPSPPASPPIQEPRPLSSFTIMSDATTDTLPPITSVPSSVHSDSPPMSTHPSFRNRPSSAASAPTEESSTGSTSPPRGRHVRSYSIPAVVVEDNTDLTLQKTESVPASVKRKPVPLRKNVTDTFKEAVESIPQERALDSMKEVASQPYPERPQDDTFKELKIDPRIAEYSRRGHRKADTPTDTSKEFVPESPLETEIERAPPSQATSHLEMIRRRNVERKMGGGKRKLRVVNK